MDSLCSKNIPGGSRPLGVHRQAWEHPNSHATLPALSAHPGTKRPDFLFVKYFEILQRAASAYRPQILPSLKPLPQENKPILPGSARKSPSNGKGSGSGGRRSGEEDKSPSDVSGSIRKPRKLLTTKKEETFYVGGGNGVGLIEDSLTDLGWKRLRDKHDDSWKLKWTECKSYINFNAFREGEQLVNHIPNCQLLTNKMGLLTSLQTYDRVCHSIKGKEPKLKLQDFIPETYRIDDSKEREFFYNTYKKGEIWICKPTGLNQGRGIHLVRDLDEFKQTQQENEEKNSKRPHRQSMGRIVQRYITNPLLMDKRKFDIRAYMLIASTSPYLVLYHKGYVRLAMVNYDNDCQDLTAHLTNQFIQKKSPEYQKKKETTAWSMDKFNDYINDNYAAVKGLECDWVYSVLTPRMKQIMIHCFKAVQHKLHRKLGYFGLYGLDFMVDENMKIWLIEINVNPCLATNCEALKEVVPGVVRETLDISIECFEKRKRRQALLPLQSLKTFRILYCGRRNGETRSSTGSPARPFCTTPRLSRSISPTRPATSAGVPLKDLISVEGKIQSPKIVSTNPLKTFEQLSSKSTPRATSVTGMRALSVVDISKSASISVLPKSQVVPSNHIGQNVTSQKPVLGFGNTKNVSKTNSLSVTSNSNPKLSNNSYCASLLIPNDKALGEGKNDSTPLNRSTVKATTSAISNTITQTTSVTSIDSNLLDVNVTAQGVGKSPSPSLTGNSRKFAANQLPNVAVSGATSKASRDVFGSSPHKQPNTKFSICLQPSTPEQTRLKLFRTSSSKLSESLEANASKKRQIIPRPIPNPTAQSRLAVMTTTSLSKRPSSNSNAREVPAQVIKKGTPVPIKMTQIRLQTHMTPPCVTSPRDDVQVSQK